VDVLGVREELTMSNFYSDSKFGVIQRKWFGLTAKHGGDGTVYTFGSATTTTHLARWYPRGPIEIQKVGYFVAATMVGAATNKGRRQIRFYTRGASASSVGNLVPATCGTVSAYTFNSTTSLTVTQCKAGEYLTIKSGTPRTYKAAGYSSGTAVQGTVNGSVAFFVDYVPKFDVDGKWDS